MRNVSKDLVVYAVVVFVVGFLTAYSASASVAPPSKEDWDAYAQLKPVKRMNMDKVYASIEADVKRIEAKESRFATNLPMQLRGPIHAISKKNYKGKVAKK